MIFVQKYIKSQKIFDFVGPLSLGEKGSYDFTIVRIAVGKCVFSKTAHGIYLKLLMNLGCLKVKN